jgi:hypothetical protein
MRSDRVVQRGLRTPTGPFFARCFIVIILGLVAECVHGAVDKAGDVVFRCTLDGSQADRWLEVPAWMFDRTACPDPELLTAQPFASIDALAALSALLDLALKERTPSAALLSGASRASHDQNRAETHVTRDGNARERIPTQSTIAAAAADRSVRDRPVERRHRRARMAGAVGGSAGQRTFECPKCEHGLRTFVEDPMKSEMAGNIADSKPRINGRSWRPVQDRQLLGLHLATPRAGRSEVAVFKFARFIFGCCVMACW